MIASGLPVAVPTETVYGLAADATSSEAVARVFAAKGRPGFNPLIVHVLDLPAAERLGVFDGAARTLAQAHWPGPLTLVVPARVGNGIASLVTAGLVTIAIRVPAHRAIRALLAAVEVPLAAPSANASGGLSPTSADHVARSLGASVTLVINDGACPIGIESTIVAATGGPLRLLRPGNVVLDLSHHEGDIIEAPGQLSTHYAPRKPLRIDAADRRPGEWLIGFGDVLGDATLSAAGDLAEAGARLFACLHSADQSDADCIAVAPVPEFGMGIAINDRLRRAASSAGSPWQSQLN